VTVEASWLIAASTGQCTFDLFGTADAATVAGSISIPPLKPVANYTLQLSLREVAINMYSPFDHFYRKTSEEFFTKLHARHATRFSHDKAVRPSVCLSVRLSNA